MQVTVLLTNLVPISWNTLTLCVPNLLNEHDVSLF